jgi:hypothetical protein
MKRLDLPTLVCATILALPTAALAQTPTGAAQGTGTMKSMLAGKPGMAERSAKSRECSAKADQQGLHGKARKTFREACKKGKS